MFAGLPLQEVALKTGIRQVLGKVGLRAILKITGFACMWDIFISHAWEDKETIARPLAGMLKQVGLRVWYDEFTLALGDSLRRSIDQGLAQSRYGVVILSPSFFSREWPQRELDGLAAREIDSRKVILPVWHGVNRNDVMHYSPVLADRMAVSTSKGLGAVLEEILRVTGSLCSTAGDTAVGSSKSDRNEKTAFVQRQRQTSETDSGTREWHQPQAVGRVRSTQERSQQEGVDRKQAEAKRKTERERAWVRLNNPPSGWSFDSNLEDRCREFLKLWPDSFEAHFELGKAVQDTEEAIAELREAVLLEPNRGDAHYWLGRRLVEKHEFEAAKAEFREAGRLDTHYLNDEMAKMLLNSRRELPRQTEEELSPGVNEEDYDEVEEESYSFELEQTRTGQAINANDSQQVIRSSAKVGRNDPCPCGSGKKYKKCCGLTA